jgi:hypothetical protein
VDVHAVAEVEADRLQDRKGGGDREHVHGAQHIGVLLDDGCSGSLRDRLQVALDRGPEILPVLGEVRRGVDRAECRLDAGFDVGDVLLVQGDIVASAQPAQVAEARGTDA